MKRPLLERIDAEVAAGRAWKAKEILGGHVGSAWPGETVSERYGVLLADLGDQVNAGKFLFLSGIRKPEYEDHIALFLSRHGRSGPENLIAQFPKSFRRLQYRDLPPHLQIELNALGVRKDAFGQRVRLPPSPPSRGAGFLATAGGLLLFVSLIVGLGVVLRQVVLWVSALWR